MTAHRIKQITHNGSHETLRVNGAPDCDTAAMWVANFRGHVLSVEAIDDDAPQQPSAENGYGADLTGDTITQALWDAASDPQGLPCKADERGICACCDTVVDRDAFFAWFPDAPDTDWRPWMTEPVEDAPRVIVWDFTK